jgi:hypothetical protein
LFVLLLNIENQRFFSYFFFIYSPTHTSFLIYVVPIQHKSLFSLLNFFLNIQFILTMVYRSNIIRSWINRSIYLRPISLFLYFIQMIGSPDSLWHKKYLLKIMKKKKTIKNREVPQIFTSIYIYPWIRCILIWSEHFDVHNWSSNVSFRFVASSMFWWGRAIQSLYFFFFFIPIVSTHSIYTDTGC